VLGFEPVEKGRGFRAAHAQAPEQVAVLLRMMELLRERIDVVNHRPEDLEIRRDAPLADLPDEVRHAVQHRRQGAVLVANDAVGIHKGPHVAGHSQPSRAR
jgi:hypothetical protein